MSKVLSATQNEGTWETIEVLATSTMEPKLDEHYLVNTLNSVIFVSTLTLGTVAVTLNLGVVGFYRGQLSNVVPFIYFILGVSDLCTGICAALHSLLFLIFLVVKEEDSPLVYWIVSPTYYITLVSFRLSAFVSLVFSIIRTINILSPFSKISRRAIYIATAVYFAFLLALCITEIVLLIEVYSIRWSTTVTDTSSFMGNTFFRPGSLMKLFTLIKSLITRDEEPLKNMHICTIAWVSTIPIILPSTLAGINTILQIFTLIKPKEVSNNNIMRENSDNTKKKVSITIATISSLFVLCSLFTVALPITSCNRRIRSFDIHQKELILYLCGYMPMFFNAALNPLILVLRGEKLREYIKNKVGMRGGESGAMMGVYGNRKRGPGESEEQRVKEGSASRAGSH